MFAPVIALLAFAWLLSLLAAPFLPASLSVWVYAIGSVVCHQLPDRSFHIGTIQLPVCARCVGIYAGAALGAVGGALWWRDSRRAAPLAGRDAKWIVAIAAMPTIVSVVIETIGRLHTSNVMRALAGFPLGLAAAVVVTSAVATLHYNACVPRRSSVSNPPPSI